MSWNDLKGIRLKERKNEEARKGKNKRTRKKKIEPKKKTKVGNHNQKFRDKTLCNDGVKSSSRKKIINE